MPTTISATKAIEGSTFIVTAAFTDEDGSAVAPDTLAWSLVDRNGTVINDRENVSVGGSPSLPSSSEDIVLFGDDLALADGYDEEERYLVLEGTYTSDAGTGLPLKDHLKFYVVNLKKVT